MEDDGDGTVEALVEAMAMHEEAFSAVPLNPAERVSPPREDEEEEEDTQVEQAPIILSCYRMLPCNYAAVLIHTLVHAVTPTPPAHAHSVLFGCHHTASSLR